MAEAPEEFYLYRHFRRTPSYRYAATIVADPKVPAGFRVTDKDPTIADSTFMVRLDGFFRQVHSTTKAKYTKAAIIDRRVDVQPGDADYVHAALDAMQAAGFAHNGRDPSSGR